MRLEPLPRLLTRRLLLDAMRGDATLFTRRDEVEAEWRIITPIIEAWAQLAAATVSQLRGRERGACKFGLAHPLRPQSLAAAAAGKWLELMTSGPKPPQRIALVVSDIDGTLLDDKKQLTPGAPGAVQRLYRARIRFTIASARPPRMTTRPGAQARSARAAGLLQWRPVCPA